MTGFFEGTRENDLCTHIWGLISYCTEVRFASFLSGGFITAIIVNPPESKLSKRTSLYWLQIARYNSLILDHSIKAFYEQKFSKDRLWDIMLFTLPSIHFPSCKISDESR